VCVCALLARLIGRSLAGLQFEDDVVGPLFSEVVQLLRLCESFDVLFISVCYKESVKATTLPRRHDVFFTTKNEAKYCGAYCQLELGLQLAPKI
jgi:hypothetical protein